MKLKLHSKSHRSALDRKYPHCRVYVIELCPKVLNHRGFRDANPHYVEGKACIYVGMTSLTPEQRFQNHLTGIRFPSEIVRRFGVALRQELLPYITAKPRSKAMKQEREIARHLRASGMGVWQG
ncbi:MAG: hypothetical protein QM680_10050 [Luteolibacter sp.]